MAFRNSNYIVTDINFDDDDGEDIQADRNSSNPDDGFSQYSNSDLQEFNNFERDIYGDVDEVSSEDQKPHLLPEIDHESGDEISDSLRLVLPNIMVRPSLGNPIETYDQLRGQYQHDFQQESPSTPSIHNESLQSNQHGIKQSSQKSRVSSRASIISAETVLSQNEEMDQPSATLVSHPSKNRNMISSISSTESAPHHSQKSHKATQKILLDKEREIRKDQDKYINHLQHTINQLLAKHALAEETIDQLRLGVVINTETRFRDQKVQRRTPNSVKKKTSRRYSSIVDNAAYEQFEDRPNLSRAKSVDMTMFEEEPDSRHYNQKHLVNEFGGSMKQIPARMSRETEIANDIKTISDYFQSRIKILNEAASNLQYNSSGRASVSSGSHHSDNLNISGKIAYDSQRDTPLAKRLKNLQSAYEDLQSDFNGFRQIDKDGAPEYALQKDEGLNDVEGDLFELGMKIDDLERTIADGRLTPTNNQVFGQSDRENDLITRFTSVEEKYQNLIDRYNDLKGSRSPTRQRLLDNVVQQLQALVKEANGRYSNIPTPDKLESMMQRDIIDKIKQHMSSDSPPYFLTEEDGLSSGNSSFGKGHRRRKGYRFPRSDEDSDFKPQNGQRLSPIKSRISTHLPEDNLDRYKSPPQHVEKAGSLPVSVISSNSMWQGATSGETLALDDQGILRDSVSRKGNSSVESDVFNFPSKSVEQILESRRHSKSSNIYNGRLKNDSYVSNNSPLHDDIKRLDEQLEKVELEEKRQLSAARDSDAAASRNTRSLLGTSPSNSIISRHSKPASSIGSSHKSQGTSSGHRQYSQNSLPKEERKKRRTKSKYNLHPSLSDSDDETPSEEYDVVDYVKSAGCGVGPRSRYVRSKNSNLQDRWSQTPPEFNRRSMNHRPYDRNYPGELEDPYIDDVAYWDGVAFHPSRESIPGKSILRRSSPNSKHERRGTRPRSMYIPRPVDMLPRAPQHSRLPINNFPFNYYPAESNVSREYYKMDPHRYLVREYGQRMRTLDPRLFEEESDDDDYSSNDNYQEERRLRDYLDEAVKAAQSMKRYTKRISDLCEQRKIAQGHFNEHSQRNYNDFYTQHS